MIVVSNVWGPSADQPSLCLPAPPGLRGLRWDNVYPTDNVNNCLWTVVLPFYEDDRTFVGAWVGLNVSVNKGMGEFTLF